MLKLHFMLIIAFFFQPSFSLLQTFSPVFIINAKHFDGLAVICY